MTMIDRKDFDKDIDREFARRAYYAVSFSPERRGDSDVDGYIETLNEIADYVEKAAKDDRQKEIAQSVFDRMRERYKDKSLAYLSAKSRCMSSMITGPANFPVRKAEKANASEHKRSQELLYFLKNYKKYVDKALDSVYSNQEKQLTELEQMEKKLKSAEDNQEFMKKCNALLRKGDDEALKELCGDRLYAEIKKPNYMGAVGFERFQLSNNLANIKRMRQRVEELKAKSEMAKTERFQEQEMNGLTVVKNFEEDRLQLLFDDKPDENVRSVLKSNGFRWAPSQSAWQRKLTNNALASLKNRVLNQKAMQQYA